MIYHKQWNVTKYEMSQNMKFGKLWNIKNKEEKNHKRWTITTGEMTQKINLHQRQKFSKE